MNLVPNFKGTEHTVAKITHFVIPARDLEEACEGACADLFEFCHGRLERVGVWETRM